MADLGAIGHRAQDMMEAGQLQKAMETAKELLSERAEAKADAQQAQAQKGSPKLKKSLKKEAKSLRARVQKTKEKAELVKEEKKEMRGEGREEVARRYQGENRELKQEYLLEISEKADKELSEESTMDDVLSLIQSFVPKGAVGAPFKDVSNMDYVLDYLIETTENKEVLSKIKEVKQQFYDENKTNIVAGQNATKAAQKAADEKLSTEDELRNSYRDLIDKQQEVMQLFTEVSDQYPAYKDMVKHVSFLLQAAGEDLRSGGPSIEPGQLHATISGVKKLQTILVIYRFFRQRMPYMQRRFSQEQVEFPKSLTFELLARKFIEVATDRFPSADKLKQATRSLNLSDDTHKQMIFGEQCRDAVRQVPPNAVFKSQKIRDDVEEAILDFLEEVYEIIADEEDAVEKMLEEDEAA